MLECSGKWGTQCHCNNVEIFWRPRPSNSPRWHFAPIFPYSYVKGRRPWHRGKREKFALHFPQNYNYNSNFFELSQWKKQRLFSKVLFYEGQSVSNPVQKLVTFFVSFSAVAHMYIRTNGENLGNKSMQCDCCCKCFRLQNQGHKKCLWRSFPACNNRCSTRRSLLRIKGGKSFAILPSKSLGDSFPQSLDTYLPSTFFFKGKCILKNFSFLPGWREDLFCCPLPSVLESEVFLAV